jgi:hypothetical protein
MFEADDNDHSTIGDRVLVGWRRHYKRLIKRHFLRRLDRRAMERLIRELERLNPPQFTPPILERQLQADDAGRSARIRLWRS